jgi:small ligand-binding sensory domain FIST
MSMTLHIGSGLSTTQDARLGAIQAALQARNGLDGKACDLAVVFASGAHMAAPEATLEAVHEALDPDQLIGCGAEGVLGGAREIEEGTAISVWAADLGDGSAETYHARVEPLERVGTLEGMPELADASGAILLADPLTFPVDPVLQHLSNSAPGVPLLGGVASARTDDGSAALFSGREVIEGGAVGVRFEGVEIVPCVSQGATPIGPELTITAAEGHVIGELAGKPALLKLRETIEGLSEQERQMVEGGLLMGIVIDANKPDYVQGDFLVRGLVGADAASGEVAVGTSVRPGQVVRLHARDADGADRDLHTALARRRRELGDRPPAGALVFACNGRGTSMFGSPDHDAEAVTDELGGAPSAGFFAAGEIGPVGGENFLHGFTATIALFV